MELDTGLYWFGAADSHQKAVDGRPSALYDPLKPTMIFFHGWSGKGDGWTTNCQRITGRCTEELCPGASGTLFLDPWVAAGWNVGLFYWDQFADESCIRDAEQKIYFDKEGDGLRWKTFDRMTGSTDYLKFRTLPGNPQQLYSVADVCDQILSLMLAEYNGPEVRFVGHSIGAQLAVRCASLLHYKNHPAAPIRLALLDPYFSKHHLWLFRCLGETPSDETTVSLEGGLQDYAAMQTADTVAFLYDQKNVFTEVYKSSPLTEMSQYGVPNTPLDDYAALVQYNPNWCGGLGSFASWDLSHFSCRHDAAIPVYFLGFSAPPRPIMAPPPLTPPNPASAIATCPTPSASCGTADIWQWVKRQRHLQGQQKWVQTEGINTVAVTDDVFSLAPDIATAANAQNSAANEFIEVAAPPLPKRERPRTGLQTIIHNGRVLFAALGLLICTICYCNFTSSGDPGSSTADDSGLDSPRSNSRGSEGKPFVGARELSFHPKSDDEKRGRTEKHSRQGRRETA